MPRWSQLSSRKRKQITALVLEAKGDVCWFPGCDARATTVDHVVPDHVGGAHTVENLEPACKSHNSARGSRASGDGRYGATTVVVTGPPASGKSTYVREHAARDDVVIDLDALARALMPDAGVDDHVYPDHVRHVAIGARAEAIWRATRLREAVTVWLIHAMPSAEQLEDYRTRRWQVLEIDPGRDVVLDRCARLRPAAALIKAEEWYSARRPLTTTSRSW